MSKAPLDLDYLPLSLYTEACLFLGKEFTRLPLRIRTGYIKAFASNRDIINQNRHFKDPDSFAMGAATTERYFRKGNVLNKVNTRGYYLSPKGSKHGVLKSKYKLCKLGDKGAVEYKPTQWLTLTVDAYQSSANAGVTGVKNGYQLSPKIKELLTQWKTKLRNGEYKEDELGLVDGKLKSIDLNIDLSKGAIRRHRSDVDDEINVNLMVNVNTHHLLIYKSLLERLIKYFNGNKIIKVKYGSDRWKDIENKIKVEGEEIVNHRKESIEEAQKGVSDQGEANKLKETQGEVKELKSPTGLGIPKRELIDYMSVKSLLSADIHKVKIKDQIKEIDRILDCTYELMAPQVPIIYRECSTGRYFSKTGFLQGYRRSVRYAALGGCIEYDLEAAHQNILLQVFNKLDIHFYGLNLIEEYTKNKASIRNKLASDVDIPVSMVKSVIQALTYGAPLSGYHKNSLYKICGKDLLSEAKTDRERYFADKEIKKIIGRIVANDWIAELEQASKETKKHLIESKKVITNTIGIEKRNTSRSRLVAHILQGYERYILDTIIKHSNRNDIALLVHDCVVFYTPQSPKELSRLVKEETGFDIEFSEDRY